MENRRGIIIHPEELDSTWPERLQDARLNVLGIHPVGGKDVHLSLESAIHHRLLPETQRLFKQLNHLGIAVEYEAHTMAWLLPRTLIQSKPGWFRMDRQGVRTPDYNLCVSDADALDFIALRAEQLARMLDTGSDRYFFWLDDVKDCQCHCPKCSALSASDQQMIALNAMLCGIRRYNRQATLCFLAYMDTIDAPQKVAPLPGITLEYAPFLRDSHRPLFDKTCEENVHEVHSLQRLLDVFGKKGSQVLEYWMDNSRFSGWVKPPKELTLDTSIMEQDCFAYRKIGFESITSFGCYLGQDYRALWGEPPVKEYGRILCGEEKG